MAGRVIRSTIECAHNIQKVCFYDPANLKPCIPINELNFPPTCPLEVCPHPYDPCEACGHKNEEICNTCESMGLIKPNRGVPFDEESTKGEGKNLLEMEGFN